MISLSIYIKHSKPLLSIMAKLFPFLAVLILLHSSLTCSASTVHTVGDNSGWDISTDLDTWSKDNTFLVGDVLRKCY